MVTDELQLGDVRASTGSGSFGAAGVGSSSVAGAKEQKRWTGTVCSHGYGNLADVVAGACMLALVLRRSNSFGSGGGRTSGVVAVDDSAAAGLFAAECFAQLGVYSDRASSGLATLAHPSVSGHAGKVVKTRK